jgi:hypothetical protein
MNLTVSLQCREGWKWRPRHFFGQKKGNEGRRGGYQSNLSVKVPVLRPSPHRTRNQRQQPIASPQPRPHVSTCHGARPAVALTPAACRTGAVPESAPCNFCRILWLHLLWGLHTTPYQVVLGATARLPEIIIPDAGGQEMLDLWVTYLRSITTGDLPGDFNYLPRYGVQILELSVAHSGLGSKALGQQSFKQL